MYRVQRFSRVFGVYRVFRVFGVFGGLGFWVLGPCGSQAAWPDAAIALLPASACLRLAAALGSQHEPGMHALGPKSKNPKPGALSL